MPDLATLEKPATSDTSEQTLETGNLDNPESTESGPDVEAIEQILETLEKVQDNIANPFQVYRLLQVDLNSLPEPEEIKRKVRDLLKKIHPDTVRRYQEMSDEARAQFSNSQQALLDNIVLVATSCTQYLVGAREILLSENAVTFNTFARADAQGIQLVSTRTGIRVDALTLFNETQTWIERRTIASQLEAVMSGERGAQPESKRPLEISNVERALLSDALWAKDETKDLFDYLSSHVEGVSTYKMEFEWNDTRSFTKFSSSIKEKIAKNKQLLTDLEELSDDRKEAIMAHYRRVNFDGYAPSFEKIVGDVRESTEKLSTLEAEISSENLRTFAMFQFHHTRQAKDFEQSIIDTETNKVVDLKAEFLSRDWGGRKQLIDEINNAALKEASRNHSFAARFEDKDSKDEGEPTSKYKVSIDYASRQRREAWVTDSPTFVLNPKPDSLLNSTSNRNFQSDDILRSYGFSSIEHALTSFQQMLANRDPFSKDFVPYRPTRNEEAVRAVDVENQEYEFEATDVERIERLRSLGEVSSRLNIPLEVQTANGESRNFLFSLLGDRWSRSAIEAAKSKSFDDDAIASVNENLEVLMDLIPSLYQGVNSQSIIENLTELSDEIPEPEALLNLSKRLAAFDLWATAHPGASLVEAIAVAQELIPIDILVPEETLTFPGSEDVTEFKYKIETLADLIVIKRFGLSQIS